MIKIYLLLFFSLLMTCALAQDKGFKLTAVETNVLSFAGGHMGPEIRIHFGRTHQKSTIFLGYRYAFTTFFPFSEREPADLTQYSQSLNSGHDFTLGIRMKSNNFGLSTNFIIQAGTFNYTNEQLICTDATPTTLDMVSYCRCDEVSLNKFTESAFRIGGALEANYTVFSRPKLQIGFSVLLGLNVVTNTVFDYRQHSTCQLTQRVESQTPVWMEDSPLWLHGIPKTKNLLTEEISRFSIAIRTGLWVTYTIN